LQSGRVLSKYKLVYETYGELNSNKSNVVVVFHALSGSHHLSGIKDGKAGWWDKVVGDNKAIDTKKYFVICINNLGSCFGSTSPSDINPLTNKPYALGFPVLSMQDIANANKRLLDSLGFSKVHAIIGGSMGGMQALVFATEFANMAKNIIAIACTAYTRDWLIAFNHIAMSAIKNDARFKNGEYDPNELKQEGGLFGLKIGRMLGHISYLSPHSMEGKFGREYAKTDGLYELFGSFECQRYLDYNSNKFANNFDALSYLYILKTLNIFKLNSNDESLVECIGKIKAKLCLIAYSTDFVFHASESKEIYDIAKKHHPRIDCSYHLIDSDYGHDSFLVEIDKIEDIIKSNLL